LAGVGAARSATFVFACVADASDMQGVIPLHQLMDPAKITPCPVLILGLVFVPATVSNALVHGVEDGKANLKAEFVLGCQYRSDDLSDALRIQ
jgi:hypothetical protein